MAIENEELCDYKATQREGVENGVCGEPAQGLKSESILKAE